jgi:hypothetical protein
MATECRASDERERFLADKRPVFDALAACEASE